jgi:hypothetical protein
MTASNPACHCGHSFRSHYHGCKFCYPKTCRAHDAMSTFDIMPGRCLKGSSLNHYGLVIKHGDCECKYFQCKDHDWKPFYHTPYSRTGVVRFCKFCGINSDNAIPAETNKKPNPFRFLLNLLKYSHVSKKM